MPTRAIDTTRKRCGGNILTIGQLQRLALEHELGKKEFCQIFNISQNTYEREWLPIVRVALRMPSPIVRLSADDEEEAAEEQFLPWWECKWSREFEVLMEPVFLHVSKNIPALRRDGTPTRLGTVNGDNNVPIPQYRLLDRIVEALIQHEMSRMKTHPLLRDPLLEKEHVWHGVDFGGVDFGGVDDGPLIPKPRSKKRKLLK